MVDAIDDDEAVDESRDNLPPQKRKVGKYVDYSFRMVMDIWP